MHLQATLDESIYELAGELVFLSSRTVLAFSEFLYNVTKQLSGQVLIEIWKRL